MTTVRELHTRAMELAQQAILARSHGEVRAAIELAGQACELEEQAARQIPTTSEAEPTRSILFRSAASLAYQAKDFGRAHRLIIQGLSGYPTAQTQQELSNLFDQVRFEHQLSERNAVIDQHSLELIMRGNSVGNGVIPYAEFAKRMERTKSLIDKTAQRLSGADYRRTGRSPFIPMLEAPRAGSFIVTLRLEITEGQQLPLFFDAAQVIDEVIAGIEFVDNNNEDGLRFLTKSDAYYNHFLSMTQDMAPDGTKISLVAFTSPNRNATLSRTRKEIQIVTKPEQPVRERSLLPVNVEGVLDFAVSKTSKEAMGLTTRDNVEFTIVVEEGMDEYVRAYFKQQITVNGLADMESRIIYLSSIEATDV